MTLFGWIFWGFILLLIVLAIVFRKKGIEPPEKSDNQVEAEHHMEKDTHFHSGR